MAADLGSSAGSGAGSGGGSGIGSEAAPIAAINVTPFVDVVLVLLVIFMVTAPAVLKDTLGIQLPKSSRSDAKTLSTVAVAVTRQGQILLDGQMVAPEQLEAAVMEALKAHPDAQAIISADADARHGDVVRAIDKIKSAGLSRFAIQIEHVQ